MICPFNSLTILFTPLLNLAGHVYLEGGLGEFQDSFLHQIRAETLNQNTCVAGWDYESLMSSSYQCMPT